MMKTELSMKGKVAGKEHICKIEAHSVFGELTAEGLFEEKTRVKSEGVLSLSIRVSREMSFGATGFDTNNVEVARLESMSNEDLAEEIIKDLPRPMELLEAAVKKHKAKDYESVKAIAGMLGTVASLLGEDFGLQISV